MIPRFDRYRKACKENNELEKGELEDEVSKEMARHSFSPNQQEQMFGSLGVQKLPDHVLRAIMENLEDLRDLASCELGMMLAAGDDYRAQREFFHLSSIVLYI